MKRRKFQEVLNILSFNRHFYVFGLFVLALIIGSEFIFNWHKDLFWLKRMNLEDTKQNINLNINAGFDETSYIIKDILPHSKLQVYDFYNAKQHTEPAIIRARKVSLVYPNTQQID